MKNVVVIFQAKQQETESLALAFGLGAVQAGADIRLRHLDPSAAAALAHAGYGTLRAGDLRWADGITVVLESTEPAGFEGLRSAFDAIAQDPDNKRKVLYLFHPDPSSPSMRLVESMGQQIGIERPLMIDGTQTPEQMTRMGKKLVENATKQF